MMKENKGMETLSNLLLAGVLVAVLFLQQYSWLLYLIILLLVAGVVLSALMYQRLPDKSTKRKYLVRKLIMLAIGGLVMIITSLV
jgi:phosphatidylserine synthase